MPPVAAWHCPPGDYSLQYGAGRSFMAAPFGSSPVRLTRIMVRAMSEVKFGDMFNKLKLPVIVCATTEGAPVAFLNGSARLLFSPGLSVERMRGQSDIGNLGEILRFQNREEFNAFSQTLRDVGSVVDMDTAVLSYQDDIMPVRLNANAGVIDDAEYFFIYVSDSPVSAPVKKTAWNLGAFVTRILQASHNITNIDDAIQTVLGLAGTYCRVSRVYIFEDIPYSLFLLNYS